MATIYSFAFINLILMVLAEDPVPRIQFTWMANAVEIILGILFAFYTNQIRMPPEMSIGMAILPN